MQLIDRYLSAIGALLPAAERADITAELRDVLLNRREEKEAALGRPLTRSEDEALLKEFGHPLTVAGRYGRQQYLIGPEFYPAYILVLKIVLAVIAASALLTAVVTAFLDQGAVARAIRTMISVLWTGGFAAVGAVTVVFAVLQRSNARLNLLDRWSVRDLPRLPRPRRRSTWVDHVAAIVVQTLFMLWWAGAVQLWQPLIVLEHGQSLHVALGPVWHGLYWPVLGLSAGLILVHALYLAGGDRRAARGLDIAAQTVALAIAAVLARAGGHWFVVTGVGLSPQALAKVELGVTAGAQVTIVVVISVAVLTIAYDAWRLYRPEPTAVSAL
jgi:hypothetical protein